MAETEIEGSSLTAIVADELRQAQTFDQTKRTFALQYMRGDMPDLPARVNGSSQTARVLADVHGWLLPQIVRVFTASDKMVEFEATKEGGEKGADEASDYTNYSFFRENDGYRVLFNASHDSLLFGNGAAASYWCPEEAQTKLFRNKTEEELAVLMDEGWQGVGQMPKPGPSRKVEIEGVEYEMPTFTVRLQKITERGYIKDITLKPENLLLNLSSTCIGERFSAYLHDDKTRSDLVAMADEYGWDLEVIDKLPRYTAQNSGEVQIARQRLDQVVNDTAPTRSGDLIDLYECYIRIDRDGDGIAELLQVWYAGNAGQGAVLSEDEWEDDVPFTDIPCYPVPHQWEAEGLYDKLADIQRVNTTLLRQGLENTYAVNWPMREVEEGSVINPDILVNPRYNGLIWKKKSSNPIIPHTVEYVADKSFAAMQMMDEVVTKRTGVGRGSMALDPEALQNQTATAAQQQKDAQVSQSELIARNMAELGWSKYFAKRRNLAKKYIKGAIAIPSKNGDPQEDGKPSAYRTIQPEAWGDDLACTINVGLGTGSRDRDMMMLNNVLQTQIGMTDRLTQTGFASEALDFVPKIIKTATQIAEAAGIKNPENYYPQLDEAAVAQMKQQAAQPKPDPALALEEAKGKVTLQVEEGKNQLAMQKMQVDAQMSQHEAELKAQGEVAKNTAELQADLQTRAADRENALAVEQSKANLELEKQARELAFRQWEVTFNADLKREEMANTSRIAETNNAARADMAKEATKNKPAAQ